MPALYFKQLSVGPMQNFCYLVGAAESPETAVIDLAWDVPDVLAALEKDGRKLTHALFTHHHFDHTGGLPEALAAGARAYMHGEDVSSLQVDVPASELTKFSGGDRVAVGPMEITALHTPGHTPGSTCYRVTAPGTDALLTGDTLFIGGCGRCDFPGGDAEEMWRTLRKITELPETMIVWPGHDYGRVPHAPLGEEKRENPYLARLGEASAFVSYRRRPK